MIADKMKEGKVYSGKELKELVGDNGDRTATDFEKGKLIYSHHDLGQYYCEMAAQVIN